MTIEHIFKDKYGRILDSECGLIATDTCIHCGKSYNDCK